MHARVRRGLILRAWYTRTTARGPVSRVDNGGRHGETRARCHCLTPLRLLYGQSRVQSARHLLRHLPRAFFARFHAGDLIEEVLRRGRSCARFRRLISGVRFFLVFLERYQVITASVIFA